jgi:hypothetical protein
MFNDDVSYKKKRHSRGNTPLTANENDVSWFDENNTVFTRVILALA